MDKISGINGWTQEIERLNAAVMEWKSLCFAQGMKLKAREVDKKELLAAINSEPELPGNMPDEMWEAVRNDRDAMQKTMRIIVRQTKANIKAAIAKVENEKAI